MFKLAAFADEIDPNPDVQIEHCLKNGVRYIELRSAIGLNVLDFPRPFQEEFKRKLDDAGMGVCCIGSPIGKVKLDQPFGLHLDRFRIALDWSRGFGTKSSAACNRSWIVCAGARSCWSTKTKRTFTARRARIVPTCIGPCPRCNFGPLLIRPILSWEEKIQE